MDRKVFAVFVAGGSGTRMGSAVPKQFIEIDGTPILQRTMQRFVDALPGLNVITVLPSDCVERWKELCRLHSFEYPQTLVRGGITRFHSVKNALEKVPDGVVVMIHDGVRPFVSEELIRKMLELMDSTEALVPVIPVTDTVKCVEESGDVLRCAGPDPDRALLWGAQTPQAFRSEILKAAYRQAFDTAFTDDASVVRKNGTPVSYIRGERFNIKITTPEDLVFADAILRLP